MHGRWQRRRMATPLCLHSAHFTYRCRHFLPESPSLTPNRRFRLEKARKGIQGQQMGWEEGRQAHGHPAVLAQPSRIVPVPPSPPVAPEPLALPPSPPAKTKRGERHSEQQAGETGGRCSGRRHRAQHLGCLFKLPLLFCLPLPPLPPVAESQYSEVQSLHQSQLV